MKYLFQAVFFGFLALGLLLLAYDHFALYQKFAVERRDKELAQSSATSLLMERENLFAERKALRFERDELKLGLALCLGVPVRVERSNPMPGFSRDSQFSMVKQ